MPAVPLIGPDGFIKGLLAKASAQLMPDEALGCGPKSEYKSFGSKSASELVPAVFVSASACALALLVSTAAYAADVVVFLVACAAEFWRSGDGTGSRP